MAQLSLKSIINGNSESQQLIKKINEVKQIKLNLIKTAQEYTEQHKEEIDAGDAKRHLLLEEGKSRGLTKDEDIFKNNELFIPTRETPLLNYLYFLTREFKYADRELKRLTEELNRQHGAMDHRKIDLTGEHDFKTTDEVPDQGRFLYGNLDIKDFNKLKKLKTMSKDISNEREAFLAFKKLNELCEKYGLDPDRVPTSVVRDDVD